MRDQVKTGIQYRPTIPGLIPEIEQRHAATHGGYTWREWLTLDRVDRVQGVAAYRIDRIVELHSNDAVRRDAEERRHRAEQRSRSRLRSR